MSKVLAFVPRQVDSTRHGIRYTVDYSERSQRWIAEVYLPDMLGKCITMQSHDMGAATRKAHDIIDKYTRNRVGPRDRGNIG